MPVPDDIKDILGVKKPAAPRSPWRRLIDGIVEGAVNSPLGAEPVARQMLKNKGHSAEEINKGERRLIEDLAAKRQAENEGLFADVDTLSPANIGKHAVDIVGNIIGGADPTYVLAPGRGPITRIASQAGINAGVDVVNQGVQIARDIRDEYDPMQTGVSAAAGVGVQGAQEVAKALRGKLNLDLNTAKTIGDKFGTVTSTLRSPERNKKVGGAKNSHHLRGNAIDIARGKGVTHKQLERAYRRAGYDIIESLDEGDHSHFAFRFGKSKAPEAEVKTAEAETPMRPGQPIMEDFDFDPNVQRIIDEADDGNVVPMYRDPEDEIDALDEIIARNGPDADAAARRQDELMAQQSEKYPKYEKPETPFEKAQREAIEAESAWYQFTFKGDNDARFADRRSKARKEWDAESDRLEALKDQKIAELDKLRGSARIAEPPPILDSSHEKFTPYVERPNTPANENLGNAFDTMNEIDELTRLNRRGELSDDDYDDAMDRILRDLGDEEANHDVLTPAERQEMDASAVRPEVTPTTPKGLGRGLSGDPANDVNVHSIADARQQKGLKDFHKNLMSSVADRVQAAKELVAKIREEGLLPFEIGDRFTTPKGRKLNQGPWKVAGYYADPKDPNRYGYRVERGSKEADDYESATMLVSDPKADAERIKKGWEPFDRAADVTGWKKLGTVREADVAPPPSPPLPNDPDFPAPGTPGNRGGPYGGDDTPIDPEKKLIDALKKAKPLNAEQRKAYHAERQKRSEMLSNIQRQGGSKRNYYAQLKSLKGDLPKVDFESIAKDFTDEDFDALLSRINFSNSLLPYEKVSAQTALMKLMGADGGKLPTTGEIKLLSEIFSRDLVEALLQNRPFIDKVWDGISNALNVPRSLMASFDLSAPFRQGVFMVGRKEFWKAWSTMFKAFGSDKAYEATMRSIHDRPSYQLMRKSGLAFSDAKSQILDEREEQFMSNWAEKIPVIGKGVEMSNRAYSAFLNKVRADVFDDLVSKGENIGIDFAHDSKAAKDLAKFVNAATGRGSLNNLVGRHGDAAAPFLSGLFFSPRLMASRLSMLNPYFYATLDPFVRKEAVKSLLTFSAIATSVLGLAAMGGADVETDPRSSDFAKIKIGNTRYDVLGGFQQYIRLGSQLLTGETKTLKGKVKELDGTKFGQDSRYDVLLRFLRTKFSPVAAYVADASSGENVIGEEFKPAKDALESFIPLFAQDMVEIYLKEGFSPHLLSGIPAFFGVGTQTYEPKKDKKKSQIPNDVKELLGAK